MALNLANIRIGFACKERWDGMVGDAQVRDCAKCKRAVFNLSEMTTAEARLANLDYHLCPHCDYEVQSDYLRCPSCMRKLKERCYSCSKPIDPAWRICPFCEAETSAPSPSSSTSRRRRRQTTDQATVAADIAQPEPAEASAGETSQRRRR